MFDAAIIGGGLAGCMAAITLAQRGHAVLLLEAGTYPRHKVCGELLSPECVTLFERVGVLPAIRALQPTSINTLRLTAPDGSAWHSRFPAPALGISRYALDAALARFAVGCGVTMVDRADVLAIDGNLDAGFQVSARRAGSIEMYTARSVVAAYGKRSGLDRALERPSHQVVKPYLGLKAHFRGAPLPQHIDLHIFKGGYCGISQVEDGRTNVCLLVEQAVFEAVTHGAERSIDTFIRWMCGQNGALRAWLADAEPLYDQWLSIGQVTLQPKTPLDGDVLFAGDSAGMIAPLAGDGMAMALHSGSLAASLLDSYLRHAYDAAALKRRYVAAWRGAFARRLTLGRLLNAVLLRPRALSLGLRALNIVPPLGDWLVTHTRDMRLVEATR